MILVLFLIISIYGSDFSSIVRFPEFMILKKIDILGYFNNLENVLVTEWMVNIFICAFICCRVIKDICPNLSHSLNVTIKSVLLNLPYHTYQYVMALNL